MCNNLETMEKTIARLELDRTKALSFVYSEYSMTVIHYADYVMENRSRDQ